jgi:hypothetical protein
MKIIKNYEHKVASHCESGTVRNILKFAGLDVSEPLMFGIGTGIVFGYLFNAKGVSGFPLTALRLPMGVIVNNVAKLCGIKLFSKRFKTTDDAIKKLDELIDIGQPAAACVEMFYMKYLPPFMQVHAPFHFITIIGREGDNYAISDPYSPEIGILERGLLKLAWETHALFSKDNLLVYVENIPENINWKKAVKTGLKRTCFNMLIPPFVSIFLPIFGISGIKMFARQIPNWTRKYSGYALREGMLFTPTILEEQGTGGGAFRFLYAAFLKEASELFNSDALLETAKGMVDVGEKWRDASRHLLKVGKKIPMKNEEYPDWFSKNGKELQDGLVAGKEMFIDVANTEKRVLIQLKKIISSLK